MSVIEDIGTNNPRFIMLKLVANTPNIFMISCPDSLAFSDLYMIMYLVHSHREPMQILLRNGN